MMIRVLHVVNAADRGGAETMAMNLYRNIDRNKIQFDFTNHKGCEAAYDCEIKSLGGRILYLPQFKGYNYIQYVSAWKHLFKAHPEYSIIHIHNYNIAGIVSRIAKRKNVKTIITHSHSTRLNMPWFKRQVFNLFHNSMLRNTTHRFSCGTNAGMFLYGDKPFTVVPNAIDTAKFKFNPEKRRILRASLGIGDLVKAYGHVGTFRVPKNHTFLIDIFAEIHRVDNTAKLILVGSGDLIKNIKTKVSTLGLNDAVFFVGQQQNVNEWLSAFDVYLMPSLWEGLPVSVVEAQCAGLPCVISDVIDKDVDITGRVSYMPLDASAKQWSEAINNIAGTNRYEMGEIVSKSEYEIMVTTKWISEFYLNANKS